MRITSLSRTAILLASIACVAPGLAQTRPSTPAGVEQRIATLHTQLHITAAEQPQWDQFAAVIRSNAEAASQSAAVRGTKLSSMAAPEVMQSYGGLVQMHAEQMQKLAAVFQTLYDGFPEEQKHVADTVFRARGTEAAARAARR